MGYDLRTNLCKGSEQCELSGVEGYTAEAQVGLWSHKTIMTEGIVGWTIHCFIGFMMFSLNKSLLDRLIILLLLN